MSIALVAAFGVGTLVVGLPIAEVISVPVAVWFCFVHLGIG